MIKEYFDKRLEDVLEDLRIKQQRYEKNCNLEHILKKDIYRLEKESDINFEVFYPRSNAISLKRKINELSQRLEIVSNENRELMEILNVLREKKEEYQYMLDEINQLEAPCGHFGCPKSVDKKNEEKEDGD